MASPNYHSRGVSKQLYFFTIAVAVLVGFVAGTRDNEIIGAVAPALGFKVATGELNLESVQNTYRQLAANYDGTLDEAKLIDGANRGMVKAAGDDYTVYMDAKETKAFNDDLSGTIGGGIGAEIGIRNDQPTIVRVLADNPAVKAGLLAGDVILTINNKSFKDKSSTEVAQAIRGDVGTTVRLSVLRAGEEKEFTITRASVTNPSVQSNVVDGVGTLTLSRFDNETSDLARRAAQSFKQQNVNKVILDLRGNGGGYLTAAQDIAGLWLDNKVVVSERTNGKVTDELRSGTDAILAGVDTVVLVDQGSASASEIVAGALKDYGVATLIGEKTFGKGTVQKVLDLGAGTQLKVTVARWYTPKGKNITKEGISPHQTIKMTAEDSNAGRDPQLEAARKELSR